MARLLPDFLNNLILMYQPYYIAVEDQRFSVSANCLFQAACQLSAVEL
jgi:hypothetical protein